MKLKEPMTVSDARQIGFYNCVKRADRSFHVQTEVFGSATLQVKTTVIEGGAIRDGAVNAVDPERSLEEVEATARAQHDSFLSNVNQGVYS